jgi:hypothetical protein
MSSSSAFAFAGQQSRALFDTTKLSDNAHLVAELGLVLRFQRHVLQLDRRFGLVERRHEVDVHERDASAARAHVTGELGTAATATKRDKQHTCTRAAARPYA